MAFPAEIALFCVGVIRLVGVGLRLFRIQSECLELPTLFGWRIAEPLDTDAAWQAAFYGGLDKVGCEEGRRDRHIDLPDAALLVRRHPPHTSAPPG